MGREGKGRDYKDHDHETGRSNLNGDVMWLFHWVLQRGFIGGMGGGREEREGRHIFNEGTRVCYIAFKNVEYILEKEDDKTSSDFSLKMGFSLPET